MKNSKLNICVVGCGYVGLPLINELSRYFEVIGYDNNKDKIKNLIKGLDTTKQLDLKSIKNRTNIFTYNQRDIIKSNIYIICVPTPIDRKKKPDLSHIRKASQMVGKCLNKNDIVIYESTVFPGCTEEICIPILENYSKLTENKDFFCGYSPERINPGDKKNLLKNTVKIVGSNSPRALEIMKRIYKRVIKIKNGLHVTKSIKVAETAKILENVQRSINISLINEISIICKRLKIDTYSVLEAASTKWNFVKYKPGLVGGHCIAIDPYYLAYKAKKLKINPRLTLSGQTINEKIPNQIGKRVYSRIKNNNSKNKSVLMMGLTFKENCPDIRHSKVFDIIYFLKKKNIFVEIFDPWLEDQDKKKLKKFKFINKFPIKKKYDSVVIAVAHNKFKKIPFFKIKKLVKKSGFIYDVKRILKRNERFIESL